MLADLVTPAGIYLRLRDRFRDTILLESTDHHAAENSFSFIAINAIGGVEISSLTEAEVKYPGRESEKIRLDSTDVREVLWNYMNNFELSQSSQVETRFSRGLFGYTSYDAARFFEKFNDLKPESESLPFMRYRLYQYVIAIDHFRDELFLCENKLDGLESEIELVESLIRSKDAPTYPFRAEGEEQSNMSDESYIQLVKKGIYHCHRGDVFQVVLSRSFTQRFTGDDFNVYRSLRNINPSPYLFYFDYGDYKLMGSSPEAQLVVAENRALLHPIAGTFKRTGNKESDQEAAKQLLLDAKENAEHVMLVDLARNDLSRVCDDVKVDRYREVKYFSHVIHLVSEVSGEVKKDANPFQLMAACFPAGTLSGAPKVRAMQIIDEYEAGPRGFYGGAIGFVGFDGSCNHAILIRSFLSRHNKLQYQAGAGVVAASDPATELQEVNNKLAALKKAIVEAEFNSR